MRPVWKPRSRWNDRASARLRGKSPWLAAVWVPCYFAPVASPPGAGGSRYAGRVVDPDVREDGETEPEVELNPSPPLARAVMSAEPVLEAAGSDQLAAELPSAPEATSRGAEVRQRLLAKAR